MKIQPGWWMALVLLVVLLATWWFVPKESAPFIYEFF